MLLSKTETLENILSFSELGVFKVTPDGNILELNKKLTQLLDTESSSFLNHSFSNLFKETSENVYAALSEPGRIFHWVLISERKVEVTFISDEQKNSFLGLVKQEKSEEIREIEEDFKLLYETSSVAKVISRNHVYARVNQAFVKLFGYDNADELIGKDIYTIAAEESIDLLVQRREARKQGKTLSSNFEVIGKRKDGTKFPVEVEINYHSFPEGEAIFFSLRDISEEKKSRDALLETEAKFKGIFNSNLVGITFANPKEEIVEANDCFLKIIGYAREDLKSNPLKFIDITPEEYLERDAKAVREFMKYGFITPYEKEYFKKDGSRVPVLIAASILENFPKLGLGFVVDISEIRQFKEEKEKATGELNTYIYRASHDLKGPLASVIGLTMVAKQEVKDPLALNYLRLIEKSTQKLDKSLINLMKVMKIKNSQFEFSLINFHALIEDVLFSLHYLDDFRNFDFATKIDLKTPFYSDADLLNSIFQNLIENSIKYKAALVPGKIEIDISESDNRIQIVIYDNGKGIDEKIKGRIFDMFFRGSLDSKGSGLGLYIVKSAVEQLNGHISAENNKNGGTQFTITLPLVHQPSLGIKQNQ